METIRLPRLAGGKVLVVPENEDPKLKTTAFKAIKQLHRAGFAAAFGVDAKGSRSYKWQLKVREKAPPFILSEKTSRRTQEAATIRDVVKLLGGQRAR